MPQKTIEAIALAMFKAGASPKTIERITKYRFSFVQGLDGETVKAIQEK